MYILCAHNSSEPLARQQSEEVKSSVFVWQCCHSSEEMGAVGFKRPQGAELIWKRTALEHKALSQ